MLHVFFPTVLSKQTINYFGNQCEQTLAQKLQCVSNPNDCRITEPVSVRLFRGLGVITWGSACTRTHTHIHMQKNTRVHTHAGFVWECIRVSGGYWFIRASFIQLLSNSTCGEKHIQAHTYASPLGLREIIVYL